MKTRTSQNGVAGIMSSLILNIKSAALALAALALAAPPALADLPAGYKQVEYIQSSGSQRIKTGFKPADSNIKVEMRFMVTANIGNTQALWCSRGNGTTTQTMTTFLISKKLRYDRNTNTSKSSTLELAANKIYTVVVDYKALTGAVTDESTGATTTTTGLASGNFKPGSALGLLASHHSGVDKNLGNYATFRVYSFKVTGSDGTVKCELVPARRVSDAVLGLYDVKRDQFLTNAGSGVFTAPAETKIWSDGASGNFSVAANWTENEKLILGENNVRFSNTATKSFATNDVAMTAEHNSTAPYVNNLVFENGEFDIAASQTIYCDTLNVGTNGNVAVTLSDGTLAASGKSYLGNTANSTGAMTISGGTLNATGDMSLGNASGATGAMTISGNGTLNAGGVVYIGNAAGATGSMIVDGGTVDANKQLWVGSQDSATSSLVMSNGTLTVHSMAYVGVYPGAASWTMEGGSATLQSTFVFSYRTGCTSTLTMNGGTLTVSGSLINFKNSGAAIYLNGGTFSGRKIVTDPANASATGNTLNINGGTLKILEDSGDGGFANSQVAVNIGERGGTIDTNGKAVKFVQALTPAATPGTLRVVGGGSLTLTGGYAGPVLVDCNTLIASAVMPSSVVITNATLAACPITVLTLTGEGADANDILSRCSLALDAPNTVELTADGALVKVVQKASVPAFARLIYDSGTASWNWEFRDITDAVIPSVDQSALEAGSITVIFGSTAELAAIGTTPAWVGGWQMASTFTFDPSSSASLPAGYTFDAGTVIDLKGCNWTLPDEWKSATVDFIVTNSVDATKAVLTIDVASGTFTETHLTLGGNIELNKTGAGTYAMTKDQPHTGGTVVTAGAMTSSANRTVAPAANSTGSLTIDGGTFTADADFIVGGGENSTGSLTVNSGTFTMTGSSRYLKLGNASGATGTVNLNGGELVMNARGFTTGAGVGEVVFNGGTLTYAGINERALFQQNLSVKVGAGGGTIAFAAGKYPTNNLSMVSGVAAGETDGGMTFKGGGTFTALGQLAYNGGTTVEIGTTLVIPDTSLGGGLAASLPATTFPVGTVTNLVTTTGEESTFTTDDLPDLSDCPYWRAKLSDDAKSIQVERIAPTMAITGFNLETGEITLGFENMDCALDLVVAWDTSDHGASLGSWPSGKSVILGTVAAGVTTGTFTLPDEVQTVGTYYRLFLGDSATKPYDEEVAWIQPNALGAYITTSFKPTANPKAEFKMNMDGQTYSSWARVFRSAAGWPNNLQLSVNSSGQIQNTRVGVIDFKAVNKTADHVITLSYQYSDRSTAIKIDGTAATPSSGVWNNYNQNQTVTPQKPITLWADADGANPSAVKLYYMKWMNTSGTVQANFIPVKKDGEYCLYDKVNKTLATNSGAEGTSFKGGAKTAYGPVTFADGQMVVSDTQQYLGVTVIDQENCSITMDGATATINWALTQPGGTSAEIVAVFQTGSTAVTNVLATGKVAEDTGTATVSKVDATGAITSTLFARSGDNKSVEVSQTFSATTVASVPTTPVLTVDETLHQIAATGMVSFGVGTTTAWLDYGATTSYGTKIDLTLNEAGAWNYTIPYDDALWKAGKVYVRVTAANEVTGVFGVSRQQKTATANASFTAAVRTLAQTAFDYSSGTATFAFGGDAVAAQDLVVAWGDRDYGENLASWPRANRKVIGFVAADATTGTFTLPREACVSGNYYRFFLGVDAVAPYDEEFEWIQPASLGAYIKTAFKPSKNPKAEFKMNMDNKGYAGWGRVFRAAASWPNNLSFAVNTSGQIYNVRVGELTFNAVSKTADHVITLSYQYSGFSSNSIKVDGTVPTPTSGVWNNYNQDYSVTPQTTLTLWANADGTEAALVKLYYMKWMSNSNALEAHFIPVKKDGEYGLYDLVSGNFAANADTSGNTTFTSSARTGYSPVTFATVQTAVSDVRMVGTIEIASRDWERPNEHVTLEWSASSVATKLWVAYSTEPISAAPGEFADPSAWNFCTNIASVAANSISNNVPYTLMDPYGQEPKYKSMRFILSKDGNNLVPLVVSEPYRTIRPPTTIYLR